MGAPAPWGWLCLRQCGCDAFECLDDDEIHARGSHRRRGSSRGHRIEGFLRELFRLHDLKGDGFLEELELVKLNEKIAMLHHGRDADKQAVKAKYQALFRSKLNPNGQPVGFPVFRKYMRGVLDELDRCEDAQEMIIEQFIAEARSGRMAFYSSSFESQSDAPFLPKLSSTDQMLLKSCMGVRKNSSDSEFLLHPRSL